MRKSNQLTTFRYAVAAALSLSILTAMAIPVLADTAVPVVLIRSIRASVEAKSTMLDIGLKGRVTPALSGSGNRLTITLPNAAPAAQLAANLSAGGAVSGISIDVAPAPAKEARIVLALNSPMEGEIVKSTDDNTLRIKLASATDVVFAAAPFIRATHKGAFDVDAYHTDVTALLKSISKDAGVNVVLAGAITNKVTVDLRGVSVERAIDLITKAAGLSFHREGETYIVGTSAAIESAYPKIPEPAIKLKPPVMRQTVYRCIHISASELVTTLSTMFTKEELKVAAGAASSSPKLEDVNTSSVTNAQSTTVVGSGGSGGSGGASGGDKNGLVSRDVVFYGESSIVERATDICTKLDKRRKQVKINVKISDINLDALKELGVNWTWSSFSAVESSSHGLNFGSFTHTPVNVTATMNALEKDNRSKLLASPNLTLLDGEKGFILIGDRLLYPKLVGYTQAQTPIFDKEEARVGIYMQVAVRTEADGEVSLAIYPQVSLVSSFLTVNGASYPQISTREQQTTIRVKDGQQIVVGGLIRDEDIYNIQRVPLLSRIPLFGELFTNRKKTHSRSEVVIMITPEIQKD